MNGYISRDYLYSKFTHCTSTIIGKGRKLWTSLPTTTIPKFSIVAFNTSQSSLSFASFMLVNGRARTGMAYGFKSLRSSAIVKSIRWVAASRRFENTSLMYPWTSFLNPVSEEGIFPLWLLGPKHLLMTFWQSPLISIFEAFKVSYAFTSQAKANRLLPGTLLYFCFFS